MVRDIEITEECLEFIDEQNDKFALQFFQLIEIMGMVKVINSNFLKKLKSTQFYELRIKSGNEYRIIIFALDHLNFAECTKAVCLCGFQKKSTKDYKKAVKKAEFLLIEYLKKQ